MKKYSAFLNFLLLVLAIGIISLTGYAVYTWYDNYTADKSAEELMSQFEQNYEEIDESEQTIDEPENNTIEEAPIEENTNTTKKPSTGGTSYKIGTYYKGYKIIGIISIPAINIQYPIFNVDNTETLRVGTSAIYPTNVELALNQPGNVVIAGHNYRSGRMFGKLHTLKNGDSIYITNIYGTKLEYKVYNNYTTGADDFIYATRETNENTEISLTTCTSDPNTRTIIWAKVE